MFWKPIQMWPFCAPRIFQNLSRPHQNVAALRAQNVLESDPSVAILCAQNIPEPVTPPSKCGRFARPECSGSPVELLDSATQWINEVEGPKMKKLEFWYDRHIIRELSTR